MFDARINTGIKRSTGDDFLEQVGADTARAGIGHQPAAGIAQFETKQVDVPAGARGFFGGLALRGTFARLERFTPPGASHFCAYNKP